MVFCIFPMLSQEPKTYVFFLLDFIEEEPETG
jgi:hypothetical protein